jgi:hypothetical protein
MADPDEVLARADERMRRMAIGSTAQQARARRRQRSVARTGQRIADHTGAPARAQPADILQ